MALVALMWTSDTRGAKMWGVDSYDLVVSALPKREQLDWAPETNRA